MPWLRREAGNPLLRPGGADDWESVAAYNPCVVRHGDTWHMLYRAESPWRELDGRPFKLSTIGHARSDDGVHFRDRRQVLAPAEPWDRYGCEDPRVTLIDGTFYIFYTCLSVHPFAAAGIRVGLATTRDFEHFERHPVTPFNAKAMALFPGRVDGQLAAILTVHTDMPPAKVAIARFERPEQLWSEAYWRAWYDRLDEHVVPLLRSPADQVEVGAPPLETADGWLLVHAYVRDYFTPRREFRVEAALLDPLDPRRVRSRSSVPLLVPEQAYERQGNVGNVVFPSGAVVDGDELVVYYGAADTTCCAARCPLPELARELAPPASEGFVASPLTPHGFERFSGNPILVPRPEFAWEARAVFNPAALVLDDKVHLLYRAMSADATSTLGYATSTDGVHVDERLAEPVYVPRAEFERKLRPGNSGCEDPRLTQIGDTIYMFYTAFDGYTPRVAFSRIACADLLARRWRWDPPRVLSPPGIDDKDGCLLPGKPRGRFVVFHRAGDCIRVNSFDHLDFVEGQWLDHRSATIRPRKEYWDNRKFGVAAPPIRIDQGWLLFFHRVTRPHAVYKVEAMLLDGDDPARVIAETGATLLEPEAPEERCGQTPNVVFPCGAVLLGEQVYLYYGGADSVVCVARMPLASVLRRMGL